MLSQPKIYDYDFSTMAGFDGIALAVLDHVAEQRTVEHEDVIHIVRCSSSRRSDGAKDIADRVEKYLVALDLAVLNVSDFDGLTTLRSPEYHESLKTQIKI